MTTATKLALDAALRRADSSIRKAAQDGANRAARELEAMEIARAEVRPYVGDVMGFDSAAAIYKHALVQLGQDVSSTPPQAMGPVFRAIARPGLRPKLAMDARAMEDFHKRFPHADRLGKR